MKYTLIGAGGIGGSMGAWLSKAGRDITYVDTVDEHIEAMRAKC